MLVGIIIGSGIFISPSIVVESVHDYGLSLLIWIVSGIICLLGALCYCELGCMNPKGGGTYAMMSFAYGRIAGFLTSWTFAFLVDPTAVAIVALTLGQYVMKPLHEYITPNPLYEKGIAAAAIILVTVSNALSLKAVTKLQLLFAACQIGAVTFLVILGIWQMAHGRVEYLQGMFTNLHFDMKFIGRIGSALYGTLWAYNGWQLVSNVTEEMEHVEKNLFRAVVSACPVVTLCYTAVNIALMTTLSPTEMKNSTAVGVQFAEIVAGKWASYVMPILVALSCYGSINAYMFACGRVTLAAGREGHMPRLFGMIHRERNTPIPAYILTCTITIMMLMPNASNIKVLIILASTSSWVIYGSSILSVIVLRFTKAECYRPFRVSIVVPIFMSLVSLFLVLVPFSETPIIASVAVGLIILGLPVYYFLIKIESSHPIWFISAKEWFYKRAEKNMNLVACS